LELKIDKVDIEILAVLYGMESTSPLCSLQIKIIKEKCKNAISYYTVVRRVQALVNSGIIKEGYKCRNAKTYFLSEKGINFIEDIFEKENMEVRFNNQEKSGEE